MSNQPGTPRDDSEMGGNFLNPFQSESVSISLPRHCFLGGWGVGGLGGVGFFYFVNLYLCHFP